MVSHSFGTVRGKIAATITITLALCFAAIAAPQTSQTPGLTVLYVDDDAPSGGDGATWQMAYRYLQDALAFAADPSNGVTEIRIAQGTYKPDQGQGHTPGNRNETFIVPPGIALRGGYAGLAGGVDPDKRDWSKFESICSGDLSGNDPPVGTPPIQWVSSQFSDNSRFVMIANNGRDNLFEGLIFSGGRGNIQQPGQPPDRGMGLSANGGSLEISNCVFRGNWGTTDCFGGGASVRDAKAFIHDSMFIRNRCNQAAAGLDSSGPDVVIERCVIAENLLRNGLGGAAGASVLGGTIRDCDFIRNNASQGAVYGGLYTFQSTTVENCRFIGNSGDQWGAISGGALCTRCYFTLNNALLGGVTNSLLGTFIDCTFVNNGGHDRGGVAWGLEPEMDSSAKFIRCVFLDNIALNLSGGAFDGGGTFVNCSFLRNDSWENGGGAIRVTKHTTMINCVIDGNTTRDDGAAIRVMPGRKLTLINTTVVNNTSMLGIGGIANEGSANLHNSIVWGNNAVQISGSSTVDYSCIQGGWNGPGTGTISNDPLFRDAFGPDGMAGTEDDDLRVRPGSPCIDTAENTAVPPDAFDLNDNGNTKELIPIDLLGHQRFRNDPETTDTGSAGGTGLPIVDVGAFEFQPLADINADGIVNVNDLLAVINAWGPCADLMNCPADIAPYPTGDGAVNVHDLLKVILSWGQ